MAEERAVAIGYKNWRTPAGEGEVFDVLDNEMHFTMDAAASHANRLCRRYCTEAGKFEVNAGSFLGYEPIGHFEEYADKVGGLDPRHWYGENVWCNPPYDVIEPWTDTAQFVWKEKLTPLSTLLLPPSVDTEWFKSLFKGKQQRYKFVETDHYIGWKTLNERFEYGYWKKRIRFLRPKNRIEIWDEGSFQGSEYDESDPESVVGDAPRAGNLIVVHRA